MWKTRLLDEKRQGTEKFQDIRRIIWSYFAIAKIYNRSGIGGILSLIVSARGTVIQKF